MALRKSPTDLLGNSAWNAIAFVVAVALNLVVLPFVVFRLGVAAFGVAGLVTACVAPALAFSNALALSTTRELAQRLEPYERDDARRFFATAVDAGIGSGRRDRDPFRFGRAAACAPRISLERAGRAMISDLRLRWPVPDGCANAFPRSSWPCSRHVRIIGGLPRSASSAPWSRRRPCCCSFRAGPRPRRFLAVRRWDLQRACFWPSRWSRRVIGDWLARPAIHRGALGKLVKLGGWQFAAQGGGADCRTGGSLLARSFAAAAVRRLLYDRAAAGRGDVYRHSEGRRNPVPVLQHPAKGG